MRASRRLKLGGAGHGVAVLLRVYAGCLDGHEQPWNSRLDQALDEQTEL